MEKIKKYFGGVEMSWKKVIILAIASAVITAGFNVIPALENTSFQDIAVNLECWFLFAVFIIMNCKSWKEASVKTFVFFLISQPLIYLFEVPFKAAGFSLFSYYKYWAIITVLTLPGAAAAYLVKKQNWLSAAVLFVATGYLAYQSVIYLKSVVFSFPHHLLSCIFCIITALVFIFALIEDKKKRAVLLILTAAVFIASFFFVIAGAARKEVIDLGEGSWSCEVENEEIIDAQILGSSVEVRAEKNGYSYLYCTNGSGETKEFYVTVSGGELWIDAL